MKKVLLLIVSLAFCGSIFAQQYESHYPPVSPNDFEQHGDIFAAVAIDNNMILSTDNYDAYEVAFYVGDECRGKDFLDYDDGDPYPMTNFTAIRYNPDIASNEEVSCRMYDHINEIEYTFFTTSESILTGHDYSDWTNPVYIYFSSSFTKEIDPYSGDGGYYLIASPLNQAVSPTDVLNMTSNEYDLYAFDQNPSDNSGLEWRNYKSGAFDNLEPGKGYLYANSTGADLTFIGAPYAGDGTVTLEKKEGSNVDFLGWNLVGNPFAQTAYPDRAFYVMNAEGSEIEPAERDSVKAMEGIFVIAATNGEPMQFSTSPIGSKGQIVLNVTQNRGNVVDRAIVRFGQESMLPKFMLNQNHTKMYIQMDDNDYAVVRSNKAGELPVNFEPAENGIFTISVNTENLNVKYLHLIDRATGMDTDLLQTPIYKFDARTNDDPRRFVLVFKTGINIFNVFTTNSGNKDDFSFFNNGNWIINNEGEAILQVIDVNGRILSSEEINGCVSKRIEAAPGVYMLRLVNGNDVKVQKIVVE